ncbi:Multidrug-efflux transporter MexB [Kluyvera cryocrescens]|uniref:Multidrug-efflux transporter MexB n=1 Tax=Kluyvera cryocrescens TaxID=580 RepID=A0A485B6L8_KLUCR|nr:Multidrug-efflux transporter MexB [Kluyvera cryocrescens]
MKAGPVPFSVMLVVPLGVIGALLATWMRGLENDVYFQVGLLTVIGLSAKNAILIVEFANERNQQGEDLMSATLEACRQRLRPDSDDFTGLYFRRSTDGAHHRCRIRRPTCGRYRRGLAGWSQRLILAIFFVPLFLRAGAQTASR